MRTVRCWHLDDAEQFCEERLRIVDGEWVCPRGHRLRQWKDLSRRVRMHIELIQGDPVMLEHFFEYRGDRL